MKHLFAHLAASQQYGRYHCYLCNAKQVLSMEMYLSISVSMELNMCSFLFAREVGCPGFVTSRPASKTKNINYISSIM